MSDRTSEATLPDATPERSLPALLALFARAEFKAPVEALRGLIELLVQDYEHGDHAQIEADVERMRGAAERLGDMVKAMLESTGGASEPTAAEIDDFAHLRHDLRTPITTILGYAELLAEDGGSALDTQIGLLHDIMVAARRLLGQIDSMVDFVRRERDGKPAEEIPTADVAKPSLAEPVAAIHAVLAASTAPVRTIIGRILLVEDNASTLDLMARLLRREGHDVTPCENGEAALALLATDEFDLVLLDLLMPGLSGIDVLERLKERPRSGAPSVIIVSALDEIDSIVRCIEAGADDYMTKPINPVLLRARVGAMLERKFLQDNDRAITERLRTEQRRSESLLRNVLPQSVVMRLRQGETVIADHFDQVSILFSDLAGFSTVTAKLSASQVLDLLNRIFSQFDRLAAECGLEKIKTIGDAYMAASGLPETNADHAGAAARMALRMPAVVADVSRDLGQPLGIRIGLHTGPVAAGIIGTERFAYDVWGDTVNVAARMEYYGDPGRVHITAETRAALGDAFEVEPRDAIDVKGRGLMKTYFLKVAE